jgi:NAD(P)H-flavin reductase
MRGMVSDALSRFHDWDDHDVYVAGPAAMISRTVQQLQMLGVPSARIHHDALDAGGAGAGG